MAVRPEDAVFAKHVLEREYATEAQVQECLKLVGRLRGEMELDDSLGNVLVKKGYLSPAQATAIEQAIDPAKREKNALPGYQLLERIGFGSMGAVYRAHHLKLDIPVAVKVLRLQLATSPTQIKRLKREAQLAAKLNHPAIVRSLDVGEARGFHYFAMEFVDGTTVRKLLNDGPLPEKEALRIVREVARALEHAHNQGVIHRDVKPGNIMLTREGRVKLVDFGLARGLEPSDLTLEHASIGTPQYVAPEQAGRGSRAGPRSDLFSLGATLYHMVTGRPPFDGENLGEIFQNVMSCRFPPPETLAPELSVDTLYLIHRLMRGDPRQRHDSASALLADLDRIEQGRRVAPSGFQGDQRAYLRRRRLKLAAWAGAAAVVLATGGLLLANALSARAAENARVEACFARNAEGADVLARTPVTGLEALRDRLAALGPGDCRPHELADLSERRALLDREVERHKTGEACYARANAADAAYGALHARVRELREESALPVVRDYLDFVAGHILERSDAAVSQRRSALYATDVPPTRDAATAALRAFLDDLNQKYAEPEPGTVRKVESDLARCERLNEEWDRTAAGFPKCAELAAKHQYQAAARELKSLFDQRDEVKNEAREHGLDGVFLDLFPNTREAETTRLDDEERAYFRKEIREPAVAALAEGDVVRAELLVAEFAGHANVTANAAVALLETIKESKGDKRSVQEKKLRLLQARFEAALGRRRYAAVADIDAEIRNITDWVPSCAAGAGRLADRAALYGRIQRRVVERYEGDSPLEALDHEKLVAILALDSISMEGPLLRGLFMVGEFFAAKDPRAGLRHLREAIEQLEKLKDPWVEELRTRAVAAEQELPLREQRAEAAFQRIGDLQKRGEFESAFVECTGLLQKERGSLRYTDFVDEHLKEVQALLPTLERRVKTVEPQIRAGLPKSNVDADPESGLTVFRFDFREWFPDEKAVAKERLEELRREFWAKSLPKEGFERYYRRAVRQLRWFSENVVPDPRGGVRLDLPDEDIRFNDLRWRGRREDELEVITIENPFRTDAAWSLELEVSWDKDVPANFCLAAGQVQAWITWATEEEHGGAKGAFFHVGENLTDHLDKTLPDFALNKKRRKLRRVTDRSWLDGIDLPGAGEPVKIRIEASKRGVIDVHLDGTHILTRRATRRPPLAEALLAGGKPQFRILSFVRCRLHSVTMKGRLPGAEEKK